MAELLSLSGPLASWIALLLVVVARMSFVIFFMPGIGEQTVPVQARLLILLALSFALATGGLVPIPPAEPLSAYTGMLIGEATIGFCLGVTLRLTIWMLTIAGTVISQSIGLSQLLGVALDHENQAMTANMLSMAGTAVLLAADFHLSAVASLLRMYTDVPVGGLGLLDPESLITAFMSALRFAILLAWPFVAINLLYNVCLGFINKALPTLMVAFVGAPMMIGAGLFLFALSVVGLLVVWKDRVVAIIGWM
ncbi:MAG: flagellar biosynthetic protein FliR [Hyphomonas sp.]